MKSDTSEVRQTDPIGVSSCPVVTIVWKFCTGPVSHIALVRALVSIKPSSVSFSESIGK